MLFLDSRLLVSTFLSFHLFCSSIAQGTCDCFLPSARNSNVDCADGDVSCTCTSLPFFSEFGQCLRANCSLADQQSSMANHALSCGEFQVGTGQPPAPLPPPPPIRNLPFLTFRGRPNLTIDDSSPLIEYVGAQWHNTLLSWDDETSGPFETFHAMNVGAENTDESTSLGVWVKNVISVALFGFTNLPTSSIQCLITAPIEENNPIGINLGTNCEQTPLTASVLSPPPSRIPSENTSGARGATLVGSTVFRGNATEFEDSDYEGLEFYFDPSPQTTASPNQFLLDYVVVEIRIGADPNSNSEVYGRQIDHMHPAFRYDGDGWYVSGLPDIPEGGTDEIFHWTNSSASMSLSWQGSAIALYGLVFWYGNRMPQYSITIDNTSFPPIGGLDATSAQSLQFQPSTPMFISPDMGEGEHTLRVVVTPPPEDVGRVYIDRAVVFTTNQTNTLGLPPSVPTPPSSSALPPRDTGSPSRGPSDRRQSSVSIGAMVGAAVGGIALLALAIAGFVLCLKLRRQRRFRPNRRATAGHDDDQEAGHGQFGIESAFKNDRPQSLGEHVIFPFVSTPGASTLNPQFGNSLAGQPPPVPAKSGSKNASPNGIAVTRPLSSASSSETSSDQSPSSDTASQANSRTRLRREVDAGSIDDVDEEEVGETLPPSYDPAWEQRARRRVGE